MLVIPIGFEALWQRAREARPEDDAPLLVLADALLEAGHAWGEFIQLQCRRARLPEASPQHAELLARERALLADGAKWLGPAWHPLIEFEFVRGLPTGRFGHAGVFLSEIDRGGTGPASRKGLRVYSYGWAFTVSVVAHPGIEKDLARWLDDKHPIVSRGQVTAQWREDGLALAFEAKDAHGTVKYAGVLRNGGIEYESHSLINGHRGSGRFTLTPADCDTRPRFTKPPQSTWDGQHDPSW